MLSQQETMTKPPIATLNLATLPLQVQIELVDFYEFLLKKYNLSPAQENNAQNTKFKKFLDNPIQVPELQNWTRDELHER